MTYNYRDDPMLGPALSYWVRKRGPRFMPHKSDIDPTDIPPKLLPNLQMIDAIDGGARFRYRLIGTALAEANGKDYTGRYPEELLSGDRLRFVLHIYQTVYQSKAPLFSRNKYHTTRNIDLFTNVFTYRSPTME